MRGTLILGIETSCDETAAAVVRDGSDILSNIISSQVDFHREFGGVVPEIASRKHLEVINGVVESSLIKAGVKAGDLSAIAVTLGPGLIGALLVGVATAKTLAYCWELPLIGVNHVKGHIWSNFLVHNDLQPPLIALVVSGGHTSIIKMETESDYKVIGETIDDAAGEAFDKIAKYLDLGYPGGPIIDRLSKKGDPDRIHFPRAMIKKGFDFSLSGLKTAVLTYIQKEGRGKVPVFDLCASFQEAVVEVLVEKTIKACEKFDLKTIALAGGVGANSRLRELLKKRAREEKIRCYLPKVELCTDNAAMIAGSAYSLFLKRDFLGLEAEPRANIPIQ